MDAFLNWCIDNPAILSNLLLLVVIALEHTAWGTESKALKRLVGVFTGAVEKTGAKAVKQEIAKQAESEPPLVQEILNAAVDAVDPLSKKIEVKHPKARKLAVIGGKLIRAVLRARGLIVLAMACGLLACATVPVITTTYPDGRIETRTDTEALQVLTEAVRTSADTIRDLIADYRAAELAAESARNADAAEAAAERRAFWERVLTARRDIDAGAEVVAKTEETTAKASSE